LCLFLDRSREQLAHRTPLRLQEDILRVGAMTDAVPPFNPRGTRYDQKTFWGRLAHFREMTDPRTLLITPEELRRCRSLLDKHARGKAKGASDHELWEAKRVKDAIVHPVTGEEMFPLGRMSAFVPVNTIPTAGMLLAKTTRQTIFWQWMNQSVNVMVNYVNRSGATVDAGQVAQAYGLAVGVSCTIAVGARKLIQSGGPGIKRLGIAVPYMAVVSAGAANVGFTRLPEMQNGVPIAARDGTHLGVSKAAAQSAVVNTILSRNLLLPIAPMLLPPVAMAAISSVVPLGPLVAAAVETCLVAGSIYGALPMAIAVFPQEMVIPVTSLEPEFQHRKDKKGKLITEVLCNKGL
jgi:tricarboxylate carrier